MDRLRVVELLDHLSELGDDVVMARHVRGQDAADDAVPGSPLLAGSQAAQNVGLRLLEDAERDGAVVVLQGGDVVVAQRQLRAGVDLRRQEWRVVTADWYRRYSSELKYG